MKIGDWETHPAADVFPLIEGDDFKALCASVKERGLEFPILLFYDQDEQYATGGQDLVLDGRNRLRACLAEGVDPRFELWDGSDPFEYVWAHNHTRRHLDASQRVAIRLKFDKAKLEQAAKRRQDTANESRARAAAAQPRGEGGAFDAPSGSVATLPPTGDAEQRKTRSELAKSAGVSPRTAQKALTVEKKAPEAFEQVAAGELSLDAAFRQVQRDEAIEQLRREPTPLPDGKFRVILADPPWPYDQRSDDATHRGAIPYHPMNIGQICALPVEMRAQKDAILFLCVTNAFMELAPQVVKSWGFEWKTILTWKKPRMGLGNYLRNVTEHVVIAVRGKPVLSEASKFLTTFLEAANPTGEHSDKPEELYQLIEQLCPGSKLELFAREAREGWTVWGSEVDGIVRRDGVAPAPATDEEVSAAVIAFEQPFREPVVDAVEEDLPNLDFPDSSHRPAGWVPPKDTRPDWVKRSEGLHHARKEPITKDEVAQLTPEQVEEEWKAAKESEARNAAARRKGKRKAKA